MESGGEGGRGEALGWAPLAMRASSRPRRAPRLSGWRGSYVTTRQEGTAWMARTHPATAVPAAGAARSRTRSHRHTQTRSPRRAAVVFAEIERREMTTTT